MYFFCFWWLLTSVRCCLIEISIPWLLPAQGIITEVTVKVHKIPAYSSAVRVSFDSVDAAAKAVQDTLTVSFVFPHTTVVYFYDPLLN